MNRKTLAAATLVAAFAGALGCGGSDDPTGPSMDDISGTWTGAWADNTSGSNVARDASLTLTQNGGLLTGSMNLDAGGGLEAITGGTYVSRIVTITVQRPAHAFGATKMTCRVTDATHCTGTVTFADDVDDPARTAAITFSRPAE